MESANNDTSEEQKPIQIIGIYTQEDEPFYLQLKKRLHLWEREGHLSWREVLPGSDRSASLRASIVSADVILLFLSADFFPDEYCYEAMQHALQEKASRPVSVIAILVRAVHWRTSPCKHLAVVPQNEKPVESWSSPDEAYQCVCIDLARLIPAWQSSKISSSIRPRTFQARNLPRSYVSRPKVFEAIKHVLLTRQGNQTTAITTALRGAGGFGKTTFALALCHDPEIQSAFPDGILWVELGEHPKRPLGVLNGVLASLEPSRSLAITLEEARDRWRKALGECRYLLVIDDVWQTDALSPLLEGGPQCVRLVTTRNDQVLPEEATRIFVDAMEPEEAIALLCRGLPEEVHHMSFQPTLLDLAKRLGYWPLLLNLANSMLVAQIRHGRALLAALALIKHAYEARGVLAFDLGNPTDRQRAVKACIEVSLRHLEEFTAPHYQAVARYQELAVFPEDTDIPLETLRRYWQGTGRLVAWEVDDLCMHLHDLSLLLTCDLSTNTIRLHDVTRSYLVQQAGQNLSPLHARFLDVSQQTLGLSRWADLPVSSHYLWQHLVLHLCCALHIEELQTTLTDPLYMAHKILYVGVPALEADLLQASKLERAESTESAQSLFEFLHQMIVRISDLLRQVSTLSEVGGLLLSYLGWQPPFAIQRPEVWSELPHPFLIAWHPLPSRSSALRRTLRGHIGEVTSCAVSPDGSFIVSSSDDTTLKVWDVATGTERFSLCGHTGEVTSCAVSPDGSFIVSSSDDTTLKVWDVATGTERFSLCGHTDKVISCAVSPDGSFIASSSNDKTLKVWDVATRTERFSLIGHTDEVISCAVSPDGSFIVSASFDGTLKIWNGATGMEHHCCLASHIFKFRSSCAISYDSRWIVSASDSDYLKVWDVATGAECLILAGHAGGVNGCAFGPDGSFIVSASDDDTLKIWDLVIGEERLTLTGHAGGANGCAFSPDGSFIVTDSHDKTLKVWDTATGEEHLAFTGHARGITSCAFSPDGSFIVSASHDKTLKIWDATTGVERFVLAGHVGGVNGCAVSPDSCWIVSASEDGSLKIWDVATGMECLSLTGHSHEVNGCTFSPDGHWIVSASFDGTLKLWDTTTGEEYLTFTGHTGEITSCAFSPDGHWIVSASFDETLKLWDVVTGEECLTFTGHRSIVWGCAFSSHGHWIISVAHDHTLKMWDSRTGKCVLTFPVDDTLVGCSFHPDGEHLVACGMQGIYFLRVVA